VNRARPVEAGSERETLTGMLAQIVRAYLEECERSRRVVASGARRSCTGRT